MDVELLGRVLARLPSRESFERHPCFSRDKEGLSPQYHVANFKNGWGGVGCLEEMLHRFSTLNLTPYLWLEKRLTTAISGSFIKLILQFSADVSFFSHRALPTKGEGRQEANRIPPLAYFTRSVCIDCCYQETLSTKEILSSSKLHKHLQVRCSHSCSPLPGEAVICPGNVNSFLSISRTGSEWSCTCDLRFVGKNSYPGLSIKAERAPKPLANDSTCCRAQLCIFKADGDGEVQVEPSSRNEHSC